jgi:CRISPR-associated protein Cmr4
MSNTRVYWLHTLSPTHVGTGRGIGHIDLPLHRDRVTGWPVIPASAFKGVWADHFRATEQNRRSDPKLRLAFGMASDSSSNAGALIPTDARLLCLPVRSISGTFAWCTSPLALQMLHRDLILGGMSGPPSLPDVHEKELIHCANETVIRDKDGKVYLEDLDLPAQPCDKTNAWAEKIANWVFPADVPWQDVFVKRFAVLPDAVFDFLTQTGTEVTTRVRIDDELKTVATGALWNEESLPAETILVGLVSCDRVFARDANGITAAGLIEGYASNALTLQVGGKATVGRGRVRCVFTPVNGGV